MWMLKCFNNKLKKRSKHDFDLTKNVNALRKSTFNKRLSMLNSNKSKNAYDMIKSSFVQGNKSVSAMNNKHLKNKNGNDKHKKLKLEDNTLMKKNKGKRTKSAESSMLFNLNVMGHHALKVKTIVAIMMIDLMVEDHITGHERLR